MSLPANILYGLAVLFAFFGLIGLLAPMIGVPMLLLAYVCYLLAGKAKRKGRELQVKRSLR
jgi:hypothetical protein